MLNVERIISLLISKYLIQKLPVEYILWIDDNFSFILGKYLELSGQLYLGGIDRNRHGRAFNQGIRTANSSLRGCLRSLQLDGRLLGLREARVTRHVAANCIWDYPCIHNPCTDGARCIQQGTDSFRCDCPQQLDSCTKPEFRTNGVTVSSDLDPDPFGSSAAASFQILNLSPIQVPANFFSSFFSLTQTQDLFIKVQFNHIDIKFKLSWPKLLLTVHLIAH